MTFKSPSKNSLEVTWKPPDRNLRNGKLTGYQVCFNSEESGENLKCTVTTALSFTILKLPPSTKYFVTVAAGTSVGYGNKSLELSKITNEGKKPHKNKTHGIHADAPPPPPPPKKKCCMHDDITISQSYIISIH